MYRRSPDPHGSRSTVRCPLFAIHASPATQKVDCPPKTPRSARKWPATGCAECKAKVHGNVNQEVIFDLPAIHSRRNHICHPEVQPKDLRLLFLRPPVTTAGCPRSLAFGDLGFHLPTHCNLGGYVSDSITMRKRLRTYLQSRSRSHTPIPRGLEFVAAFRHASSETRRFRNKTPCRSS